MLNCFAICCYDTTYAVMTQLMQPSTKGPDTILISAQLTNVLIGAVWRGHPEGTRAPPDRPNGGVRGRLRRPRTPPKDKQPMQKQYNESPYDTHETTGAYSNEW